jgi:hypothetical protein
MQNQNILRFLIFHCISRQNTSQMLWKGVIDTFMLHERHIDTRISCLLGPEICTLWVRLRARTQVGAFTPGQITSHYRRKRKLPIPRHAKRRGMHRNWLYEAFVRYRLRGIFCEMPYICISLSVSTLLSSPAFDLTNYYWCSSWAPMHCFSPCVVLCARLPELTTAYACMHACGVVQLPWRQSHKNAANFPCCSMILFARLSTDRLKISFYHGVARSSPSLTIKASTTYPFAA